MRDKDEKASLVYLKQREMCIANRPTIVSTVLGSCISVTMFDRRNRVGGICHALLPRCHGRNVCSRECPEVFRYVDCSIERMLSIFSAQHTGPNDLEVKIFGGGSVIVAGQGVDHVAVGNQNIMAADEVFRRRGVSPVAVDVGGSLGRKVIFYTHTGEVYVKRLNKRLFSDTSAHAPMEGENRTSEADRCRMTRTFNLSKDRKL